MPNYKPMRRSQLISPFGVGALVDFRGDESLMTAGLDAWPYVDQECPAEWLVREERLEARLSVSHFRLPPDYREPGSGDQLSNQHIPFVRFPRWHYCPRRGAMEKLPLFSSRSRCPCRSGLDCNSLPENRRPWLIPNRFIAICRRGHIEDFPFMDWIHKENSRDVGHKLRLLPGRSSAGLSGIKVECNCGNSETMAGAFNVEALSKIDHHCTGGMPWVGVESNDSANCGEHLRVVQRGASNVYFPSIVSSIYLPLWGEDTDRAINMLLDDPVSWDKLTSGLDDGKYIQVVRCEVLAPRGVDPEELRKAAQKKLDGVLDFDASPARSEEEFRWQEYEALRDGRGRESTELEVTLRGSSEYGQGLCDILSGVGLVKKLRETRALAGFSRALPAEDPSSPDVSPLSLGRGPGWLPAVVVFGEGIFILFDKSRLEEWAGRTNVKERTAILSDNYNRSRLERGLSGSKVTPKYVLLHTISHVLITQLSFDCGYGSASLKERIYCELEDSDKPMQGILIYTASGDSEGTLGGLVRQGHADRLTGVIMRALHQAGWCSSDPVCIESYAQGTDNANLAACHGCVLLPETSCETGNRLLDRGLLVGLTDAAEVGFFPNGFID